MAVVPREFVTGRVPLYVPMASLLEEDEHLLSNQLTGLDQIGPHPERAVLWSSNSGL